MTHHTPKFEFVFTSELLVTRDTHMSVLSLDKLRNLARYSTIKLLLKHFSYTKD